MAKPFYSKLAFSNIKNNYRLFVPYFISTSFVAALLYLMFFVLYNDGTGRGGSVEGVLRIGCGVIGLFSVALIFYADSFIVKRRTAEFGLYNVLGLEKRHIAKVIAVETAVAALIAVCGGLALGILFSKLAVLLLTKLIGEAVQYGFQVPYEAVLWAVGITVAIYILVLIYNLIFVYRTKPIELLKSSKSGEKEPKTKIIMTVIGVLCLAGGYTISIVVKSPLSAMLLFFLAVILVIVGTYCLFIAGSVAFLKACKKNKKFYYNPKRFTAVSGLIYRMKQNAAGLAGICILSTAVLVMLSTTVALNTNIDKAVKERDNRDVVVKVDLINENDDAYLRGVIDGAVEKCGADRSDAIDYHYREILTLRDGSDFVYNNDNSPNYNKISIIYAITQEEFNRSQGQSISLGDGEIAVCEVRGSYDESSMVLAGKEYRIASSIKNADMFLPAKNLVNEIFVTVFRANEEMLTAFTVNDKTVGQNSYYYGFNWDGSGLEEQELICKEIRDGMKRKEYEPNTSALVVENIESIKKDYMMSYGSLLFLGIFLGAAFLIATVLILYYKQLSEGFEDKTRFEIMHKVGMEENEVKSTIRTQVLLLFFLPFVTAIIHLVFASPMLIRLLSVLNFADVGLYAACAAVTAAVFAVFYAATYILTARVYYKIVSK